MSRFEQAVDETAPDDFEDDQEDLESSESEME